jgi:hypothetical protein
MAPTEAIISGDEVHSGRYLTFKYVSSLSPVKYLKLSSQVLELEVFDSDR